MNSVVALLLGLTTVVQPREIWNYEQWGADWPNIDRELLPVNHCGGKNQSPIDLKSEGWPIFDFKEDLFQKIYQN